MFDPTDRPVRDPQSGATRTHHRDRRARRHDAAGHGRDLGLSPTDPAHDAVRHARDAHDPPRRGGARGSTPTRPRGGSSVRSSPTAWRRTRPRKVLHDAIGASYTMNWLLLGFMGLGLIVGVAALGVISARSVVERRQQIGVLRSIGFRRGHGPAQLPARVLAPRALRDRDRQRASAFVVAYNVIRDSADQPSWQGAHELRRALAAPGDRVPGRLRGRAARDARACRASGARPYPAEALRYE